MEWAKITRSVFDHNNMFNAGTVFEGEFLSLTALFRGQNVAVIVPS